MLRCHVRFPTIQQNSIRVRKKFCSKKGVLIHILLLLMHWGKKDKTDCQDSCKFIFISALHLHLATRASTIVRKAAKNPDPSFSHCCTSPPCITLLPHRATQFSYPYLFQQCNCTLSYATRASNMVNIVAKNPDPRFSPLLHFSPIQWQSSPTASVFSYLIDNHGQTVVDTTAYFVFLWKSECPKIYSVECEE